jgi:histidine triad (HIT) family protein
MSETCAFCRIVRRQRPAYVITEDDHIIVFLSKENHPLVVPKQHIPNIYTLDETTGAHLMKVAVQVARAVKAGLQCEGVYLTQANEAAAGQDVFHLHLHIYPRWQAVAFETQQMSDQVTEEDKQVTLQKLRVYLAHTPQEHAR